MTLSGQVEDGGRQVGKGGRACVMDAGLIGSSLAVGVGLSCQEEEYPLFAPLMCFFFSPDADPQSHVLVGPGTCLLLVSSLRSTSLYLSFSSRLSLFGPTEGSSVSLVSSCTLVFVCMCVCVPGR